MHAPLTRLLTAYQAYSTRNGGANEQLALANAARALSRLERRLAAVSTPPAAAKLGGLLLQFVGTERSIAAEIAQLARFMPRFHALTTIVAVGNARLAHALAATKPPTARAVRGTAKEIAAARAAYAVAARDAQSGEADAVDAYDRVLALALLNLAALRPPAVIVPAYRAEVTTLDATHTAGAALPAELRKPNATRVSALGRRFDEAARLSGTLAAQRAEIAAIKAYDRRVRSLGALQARIQVEVLRLQRLGAWRISQLSLDLHAKMW
jgi:hypothetical protein